MWVAMGSLKAVTMIFASLLILQLGVARALPLEKLKFVLKQRAGRSRVGELARPLPRGRVVRQDRILRLSLR